MWSAPGLPRRAKHTSGSSASDEDTDSEEVNDLLVIGIDFGTTYSGVAWATASDFNRGQVNLITVWPEGHGEQGKAPTELCYDEDGDNPTWGYEIPADADPVRWFKLLLLKSEDLAEEIRDSEYLLRGRRMMKENGKTAIDFVSDYLQALWQHVLETITKARGETVVEALSFHVVITVPAIWKGYARQAMEEAAKKAGILDWRPAGTTTLSFAPEPEAAALATLSEQGEGVKEGDVYVICDAGGGTVDLISYKITKTKPIAMEEAVLGTGGLCGGIFIDEAFEAICKKRLGTKWNRLSRVGIREIMKGEWEFGIKSRFKPGNSNKEYILKLPLETFKSRGRGESSRASGLDDVSRKPFIKDGRIHFKESHVENAFTEVFSSIAELIDSQLAKANEHGLVVSGIILVGGLGASPFLYETLKADYTSMGITILQSSGMKPRTAICRGAVFKGFLDGLSAIKDEENRPKINSPIAVTSTIARASYGISFSKSFEEGVHREEDKYYDEDKGTLYAIRQLVWYLKKGDNITKMKTVRHGFSRTFNNKSDYNRFSVEIQQYFLIITLPQSTTAPFFDSDSTFKLIPVNNTITKMGRWGMRLFEGDQDLEIAIQIGRGLGDSDDMDQNLLLMVNQTDHMLPHPTRRYYKTDAYLKTELPDIVAKRRVALDSGIGDQLFRIFRAKETDHDGKYRVIILGALMMRAGAKIRDDDLQHLRDLFPQIHSRPGLAPSLRDNPSRPSFAAMWTSALDDHGFRGPGRAQFLAALGNYKAGVPRSYSEPSCYQCGKIAADVGKNLDQCSRCKRVWYCNKDCQKAHWKDHKPACIAPEKLRTDNV
ncbi:hypothetical protein VPNG_02135 [Cytospora leucostoma]|uniref:MYND-type domain-containing protein n=1 Tax=Cytospora leucostoma TaxID=1230097 RepID=A0A423XHC6_9PEZI|nr:hypothetical protein VPNG_02135 [Cytospora leucostoma]